MTVRSRVLLTVAAGALTSASPAGPARAATDAPAAVETPGVELTVDRFGSFDYRTGVGTVTGTLACPAGFSGTVSGSLSQARGPRTTSAGTFSNPLDVPCTGTPERWSIPFAPLLGGRFTGGPADLATDAVVCLSSGCLADSVNRRIILRG